MDFFPFNLLRAIFGRKAGPSGAIGVDEAAARLQSQPELQLIDVRSGFEFSGGHLPGAKRIGLQELESRCREIDRRKPVLLYCRSGHRSGIALQILRKNGFENAVHLDGGILAWQAAGKSLSFTQS
jgi:rhodanese-related sulfurtransferase